MRPSASSRSSGAASNRCAAMAQQLVAHVAGRAHDGAAADHGGAAAVAPGRIGRPGRVALHDLDVLEPDAELVGGDLRHRRLVPLAVRLQTGRERDRPVGLHRDAHGVEVVVAREALSGCDRAGPGPLLDERAEADAEEAPLCAQLALTGAQFVVADQLHGAADRLGEAAAVVVAARRGAIGDAVRDGVAEPQLDRVDAELARGVVDQRLARGLPRRPADAAIRRRLALVRERRVDRVADVLDVVEARQERGRAERVDEARPRMREVCAAVADVAALEGEEAAVGVGGERELAHDLLRVAARGQRLVAVFDPLDRRAQAARQLGDDRLLDEQVHLEAEAASDGRADDPYARVLQPELRREHAAHEERHLRRRPDRDRPLGHVPVGDHAAALERRRVACGRSGSACGRRARRRRTPRRRRPPRTRCARSCCRPARRAAPARRARAPPPRRAPPAAARTRRRSARRRPRRARATSRRRRRRPRPRSAPGRAGACAACRSWPPAAWRSSS